MIYPTWKKIQQPAIMQDLCCMLAGIVVLGVSCSSSGRIYEAPRMGAEYRFDDGLPKEKKPQYLFDKKTRKEMAKRGYPQGTPNSAPALKAVNKEVVAAPQADTKTPSSTDGMRMDSAYKVRPQ
jgi:hypothetical protein